MQNFYLEIDGIKGESTSAQGKDMIEILSFSHGISMPLTASASGAGRTHGRAVHQDMTVSKYLDLATTTLNAKTCGGDSIKKMTIHCWGASADGAPIEYYKIEFTDVIITSISIGGGGGDRPVETACFNYNQITWTYTQHNHDSPGAKKGNASASWDLQLNKSK